MTTVLIIVCIVFCIAVILAIVTHLGAGIASDKAWREQHRSVSPQAQDAPAKSLDVKADPPSR